MYKQNLHTHTRYCDGSNTPEEMIEAAIAQGFDSLGFSGHGYTPFSSVWCMSQDTTRKYREHITRLKKEYEGRIKIYLGLECDIYTSMDPAQYDYLIGSVHYLPINDNCVSFDSNAETVRKVIDQWFDGDGLAYAMHYYKTLATMPQFGPYDIIGHADIITKHCEKENFFDPNCPEYRRSAIEALDALEGKIPYFELNTGAISRGYRTTPYPAPFLLDALRARGFGAVITSDCHNGKDLSCYYPEAQKLLWEHGFREIYVLTDDGFVASPL